MKGILSVLLAILLVFNLTAVTFAIAPPYISSVAINADGIITMYVGDEITLEAVAEPEGYRYVYMTWGSNAEDVVTVSGFDGTTKLEPPTSSAKLTALAEGSCVVSAYAGFWPDPGGQDWRTQDSITIRVLPKENISKKPPLMISFDESGNGYEVVNRSDDSVGTFDIYVVYYNSDGSLNTIEKTEDITLSGEMYAAEFPAPKVFRIKLAKVFAWEDDSLVPLSNVLKFSIN